MNNQEAFNKVYKHFITDGNPRSLSVDNFNSAIEICAYRGGNGAKCALGCLIPDELYHPSFEGRDWSSIYHSKFNDHLRINAGSAKKLRDYFKNVNSDLLVRLQGVHDTNTLTIEEFQKVAAEFSLEMPC